MQILLCNENCWNGKLRGKMLYCKNGPNPYTGIRPYTKSIMDNFIIVIKKKQ